MDDLARRLGLAGLLAAALGLAAPANAAPKQGDFLQTNSLSTLVASRDFTLSETKSLRDHVNLSGIVGLHYYVADGVRLGMGLQFTERVWPEPAAGSSRFQRFALMPQLGWNFCDPFYTGLIFSYAPRTLGRAIPDLAVLGVLGVAAPLTRHVRLSFALEPQFAFHYHRSLGLVALTGLSLLL